MICRKKMEVLYRPKDNGGTNSGRYVDACEVGLYELALRKSNYHSGEIPEVKEVIMGNFFFPH